jgi:pyruvate dehydrogenase E1 component alpha subunit
MEKCPIKRFEMLLLKEKVLAQAEIDQIKGDVKKEIDEAVEFANTSPFPKHEDIYQDVFQGEMGGSR